MEAIRDSPVEDAPEGQSGADDLEAGSWPGRRGVSALGPVGERQQLLRMECMSARHTRQLLGSLTVARDLTILLLLALLVLRLRPLGASGLVCKYMQYVYSAEFLFLC